VSAFSWASPGARKVGGGGGESGPKYEGGVFTSEMVPEYQRPSGPLAHTLVPMMERLAKRRPVDIFVPSVLPIGGLEICVSSAENRWFSSLLFRFYVCLFELSA